MASFLIPLIKFERFQIKIAKLALTLATTRQYIEWFKQGHKPPPISVVRHVRGGHLVSCNRRRWLAAREAGVETLKCWYSPTHNRRAKWELKLCLGKGDGGKEMAKDVIGLINKARLGILDRSRK